MNICDQGRVGGIRLTQIFIVGQVWCRAKTPGPLAEVMTRPGRTHARGPGPVGPTDTTSVGVPREERQKPRPEEASEEVEGRGLGPHPPPRRVVVVQRAGGLLREPEEHHLVPVVTDPCPEPARAV